MSSFLGVILGNVRKVQQDDVFYRWCVLFSHPADFTPVCTTELGRIAVHKEHFEKRNVKVLAHSVDDLKCHVDWVNVSVFLFLEESFISVPKNVFVNDRISNRTARISSGTSRIRSLPIRRVNWL